LGSIRFRKSIKIAPGVRMSVSKTGFGVSAGVRGARYSVHTSGRRTTTIGIPGTGLSHISSSYGGRSVSAGGRGGRAAAPTPAVVSGAQAASYLPKAGFLASKAEKQYRVGLVAYLTGNLAEAATAMEWTLASEPKAISAHIVAAISMEKDEDTARAIRHLEAAVESQDPFPDKLMQKFLPAGMAALSMSVKITDFMSATVPFNLTGAALLLAEGYQQTNRLDEAIGLVQQLHEADPTNEAIALSLVDLLFDDKDYEGVVGIAANARNDDDLGVALLYMRAAALTALGHITAAFDAFREALAKTAQRDPDLLATVRYDRALSYEMTGQKAKAKADYERLYAANPGYRDVRQRLAAL
jgi:tetratricopeptide (TPR) repeat protein